MYYSIELILKLDAIMKFVKAIKEQLLTSEFVDLLFPAFVLFLLWIISSCLSA